MLAEMSKMTSYDILHDVDAAIRDALPAAATYYVLGGIGSSALAHADTIIDGRAKTVTPKPEAAPSLLRPNGTRRDIDVLVGSVLPDDEAECIKQNVKAAIDDKLVVSVFGFDAQRAHLGRPRRYVRDAADWISSRTVDEKGGLYYELFPLIRQVDPTSYEPWKLALPSGQTVDMLHPAGHTLAYRMRSVSGVRVKDAEKLEAMERNVLPKFESEVQDGVFKEWRLFAHDIDQLVNRKRVSVDGRRTDARSFDSSVLRGKGKVLGWLERQENLVDFAQGEKVQRVLNMFVRAK